MTPRVMVCTNLEEDIKRSAHYSKMTFYKEFSRDFFNGISEENFIEDFYEK